MKIIYNEKEKWQLFFIFVLAKTISAIVAYEYVSWFKTLYIALPMIATLLAIIYVWNAIIFLSRFVLSSLSRCVAPYIIPFIESDTIGKVNKR
jgi:hypothetical protein